MNIWIITCHDFGGERLNEIACVLFNEALVTPKVAELFAEDRQVEFVRVETWYRDHDEDDASFYDWEVYSREEMKEGI